MDTKEARAAAVEKLQTLCEFIENRVKAAPADEALREFNKAQKRWESISYGQLGERIRAWRAAFTALALGAGERVAMLLPNGANVVYFDQAALSNRLIPVPLHAIDTAASSAYILQDCQASFLITTKHHRWQAIEKEGQGLPNVKTVILTEEEDFVDPTGRILTLKSWLQRGQNTEVPPCQATADDLACIVYTSGTTGQPKGVMLTHKNVASNVVSTLGHVKPEIGATFLSFLPLSHMFERTAGYYLALATGSTIVFSRSLQYLAEDFRLAKPEVLISVPRIYERIYAKLNEQLAKKGAIAKKVFEIAVDSGWREFCKKNNIPCDKPWTAILDPIVGGLLKNRIAKRLAEQFGGNLKVAISGGAALNHDAAKVFCGLGLPVIQGYGMTETSPIIAGNNVTDNDPATVGRVLKNVEVKIGDKDEILVRGDLVMKGYWGREEATADVIDSQGWLHTGDQGRFDQAGRLKIIGRIKEIIVTSTGEKIAPVDIESAVEALPLVNQCMAVGDGRPYVAVVLSVNPEVWEQTASQLQLDGTQASSLKDSRVKQHVISLVRKACKGIPAYALPRNVSLTLEQWTIDNGLLTPTLKIKRDPLKQKYASQIRSMYQGAKG